jgi:hypothetical protein
MALVDLVRRRKLVAAALAGAVAGVVVGLFLPIRAAAPPKSDEAAWSLPDAQAVKRFRTDQFQAVRTARFWGELQLPGQRGAQQGSGWTLAAIVTRPRIRVAVNAGGGGAAQQTTWVGLGEELPDGATLVAANRDAIWFEKDGCRRVRMLYQKPDKAADPGACVAPGQTAPARPAASQPTKSPAPSPARTSS